MPSSTAAARNSLTRRCERRRSFSAGGSDGSDAVYLLTFVHDDETGESLLSIVDGETMEQVALLRVPERVPFGLHGHWVPEEELQAHTARQVQVAP